MRNAAIVAGTAVLFAAGSAFAQGGSISLNIVVADQDELGAPYVSTTLTDALTPALVGGSDEDKYFLTQSPTPVAVDVLFYVVATQTGDTAASGIASFDGLLSDGGAGGSFSAAALSITEATGLPFPGTDFDGRTGMFPNFRGTIGGNNNDLGNGGGVVGSPLSFLPLDIQNGGRGQVENETINVYKFRYTNSLSADATISVTSNAGGYWANGILQQPAPVSGDSVTFSVPAPGATALLGLGGLVALRRRR